MAGYAVQNAIQPYTAWLDDPFGRRAVRQAAAASDMVSPSRGARTARRDPGSWYIGTSSASARQR